MKRFDEIAYTRLYPHVRNLEISPEEHFKRIGSRLGYILTEVESSEYSEASSPQTHPCLIAIPLYKNPQLVGPLTSSILECADELSLLGATILFVIDSPDDQLLVELVESAIKKLRKTLSVQMIINDVNLGFIASMNKAIDISIKDNIDLIMLNSDARITPGAITEMISVASLDHMIGFVSPRSNNATICSMPYSEEFRHVNFEESYKNYLAILSDFPKFTYVPTVVGFAMLIKVNILKDFGHLDTIYGMGYNEENDLVMRANRCGYRAVIANHAYVYHEGEKSFGLLPEKKNIRERENAVRLLERYPEYKFLLDQYFSSPEFLAAKLLDNLIPNESGKLRVGLDLTPLGKHYNGTIEVIKQVFSAFVQRYREIYDIYLIGNEAALRFHGFESNSAQTIVSESSGIEFAALLRIGQPFHVDQINWQRFVAPVVCVLMFDTIALDCGYLSKVNLKELWQWVYNFCDIIVYNSEYTKRQFSLRLETPSNTATPIAMHSTNIYEYPIFNGISDLNTIDILVVGNHFAHKAVEKTVEALKLHAGIGKRVAVLGMGGEDTKDITYFKSGLLDDDFVTRLYSSASVVLFPSHYEGFGLPVINALAHKKPVIVRRMPVFEEIAARTGHTKNIHMFGSINDMVNAAVSGEISWDKTADGVEFVSDNDWKRSAEIFNDSLEDAWNNISYLKLVSKIRTARYRPTANGNDECAVLSNSLAVRIDRNWEVMRRGIDLWASPHALLAEYKSIALSSNLFDPSFYKFSNEDLSGMTADELDHFILNGELEGRNPCGIFDANWYKKTYTDTGGCRPFLHYLCYGLFEEREIKMCNSSTMLKLKYSYID